MKTTPQTNAQNNITDIPKAVAELDSDLEKSINAHPLYKTVGMQIMLIALNAQAELKKHSAPGPISVQVIKGSISFRTDEMANDLITGQIITLEAQVPHSVYAHERSIFLVTKSIPDQG